MPQPQQLTTKSLRFAVKDAEKGQVEAVFATFNVVDHDGDLTLPGAFEDGAEVPISAYGHGSWMGRLPAGKGTIKTNQVDARLEGQFFLSTETGKEHFETIKAMGQLQEWSYGYDVIDAEFGQQDGQRVRILKKLKVREICPVLAGAGIDTHTVDVKSRVEPAADEQTVVRRRGLSELLRFERTRVRLAS